MKTAAGKRREITISLAILLPCLLMGIYGLLLTLGQKRTLEIDLREKLAAGLSRIAAAIQGDLENQERQIISEIAAAISHPNDRSRQQFISAILARHPLASYPFILDTAGDFLFPAPAMKPAANKRPSRFRETPAMRSPSLDRAEFLEYEKKDVAAALRIYVAHLESAGDSPHKSRLLEAVGRSYFKLGKYRQAASYYQSLEAATQGDEAQASLYFLALRQQALCQKLEGRTGDAYAAYLRLYETVLPYRGEETDNLELYRLEALDFLKTFAGFSLPSPKPAESDLELGAIARRLQGQYYDGATESALEPSPGLESERRRFEKIREIYNPSGGETLFYPSLKKHLQRAEPGGRAIRHIQASFGGLPFVIVSQSTEGGKTVAGFCLDSRHIRDAILPRHVPGAILSPRFQVVVSDRAGTRIYPDKTEKDKSIPVVAIPLSGSFPGWNLAVHSAMRDALAAAARKNLRGNYLLLAGLVAALAFGLFFFFRSLSRERQLLREKTLFVRGAAHNLKTPLTQIRLLAEKLRLGWLQDKGKTEAHYDQIVAAAQGMADTIGRLLDFSRLEEGRKTYHFAPVDVGELIRETVELFSPAIRRSGMRIETSIPSLLPGLIADREALGSALANLIDNAVKYAATGKIARIAVLPRGDRLLIDVADSGPGIPPGQIEQLFTPFHRSTMAKEGAAAGYGLGLYLAREAILAHGGDIAIVESGPHGSTFRIELPLKKSSEE